MTEPTIERVLEVLWSSEKNILQIKVVVKPFRVTKRRTFNYVSSIFNLFRLLVPFLLRPKIIIQDICWLKLDWDTPMPGKLENVL